MARGRGFAPAEAARTALEVLARMTGLGRLAAASVVYFTLVFGAGFLLGPIRVVWLEPRLGRTIAVLCELPFLLTVMILAARWLPGKIGIPQGRSLSPDT